MQKTLEMIFTAFLFGPSPAASHPFLFHFSEASLPPLRVTPIHFAFFFLRAGPLSPNLLFRVRFGQTWSEPRLFKISWETFGSIHQLVLSFNFPRAALFLETHLPLLWNSLFLFHAPALTQRFLAKVRQLFTLTFSHLTIW